MKIRKSKYHQKSVKVAHFGALIWRKFPTNCDAHLAESLFQTRSRACLKCGGSSLVKTSVRWAEVWRISRILTVVGRNVFS